MPRIFMYGHGGSENHGCEAIVRSTVRLLGDNDYYLFSTNPQEDRKFHIDNICKVLPERNEIQKNSINFLRAFYKLKIQHDYSSMDKLLYNDAFNKIHKGDIALSIGGDNYCYADVERYILMHELAMERGAKTVLWGCSIDPSLLGSTRIASDLKKYDYIFARESITYKALRRINKNTVFMPDTAFLLNQRTVQLPAAFLSNEVVGINISPMVIGNEKQPGIVMQNYIKLIEYILNDTDFSVALVPHVIWEDNNDILALEKLFDQYKESERVFMIPDQSCECLKYLISRCRFFIGARTHSTIAAYSTAVPTIVVGYSVKADGIAKDIFGAGENYIVSCTDLKSEIQLQNLFIQMMNNESIIRTQLELYNSQLPKLYSIINKYSSVFGEIG